MCNACHARYDLESFIRLRHGRCRVVVGVVLQVFMVMSPLRPVQIEGNVRRCQGGEDQVPIILLMEEILYQMRCINPVNNGIFTISTGAGFLPLTV